MKTQNNNMAPVSDTALRSKLAQGLFFFEFQAQPEGRMTQEYDTTTERKLWFSGGSERLENCPVDSFQRRTGRQAPELGAEPINKLLQNLVSLHCLLLFTIMSDKMDLTSDLSFTTIGDRKVTLLNAEVTMAKDTKERILMAALDMFSKKGYEGTNIRELAASRTGQVRHLQAL